MQLILRPVSDAQLQEIIVTDSRFAIGRNEDHFKTYDRSVVQKLSRRHARVFERDGCVFIVDLQSSNGTTVNGQIVEGEPVQLRLNDEVQFGGLKYRVEHLVGADAGTDIDRSAADARVVLEPAHSDGTLHSIVISKFPFLVGRKSTAFDRCKTSAADQLSQISKKHAHIFLQGSAVHIEDLGSTNGTFVCGEELTEKSRPLNDGDTVSFGGDFFTYEVQTFVGKDTVAEADSRIQRMPEGTIFVDDATNFFEIYMGGGDGEERAASADVDSESKGKEPSGERAGSTRIGRKLGFLQAIRGTLRSGEPFDKRLRWTIMLAIVVLAAGLLGYWYVARPVQRIERLLEDHRYPEAAELANEYLVQRSDDERIQELATEALLKTVVPRWQSAVVSGDFSLAEQALANAYDIGVNNPKDNELIVMLELATKISAFDATDRTFKMSVDLLSDDALAGAIVDQWDERDTQNARALSRVELHVDGFDEFQAGFYRRLRALRGRDKDLEPLHSLRRNIVAALEHRDTSRLRQHVKEFSTAHPDVAGLDRLQEDLLRYEAVEQDIADARWLRAYDRLNYSKFHTAPFAGHATVMNEQVLPDAATRAAYEKATNAWIEGNALECFEILEELENLRWGDDAKVLLERNRKLLNNLVDLQRNREAADFEDRLFTLYGELDPKRDEFLRHALQSDFQAHSQSALNRAADRLSQAERVWKQYDESGRLRSVHRLEERVSGEYRNLAGLLTQAYRYLRESEGIYRQLEMGAPENWTALNQNILQEIKLQTRAIGDLLVIEPDVQKAKLDLLPDLPGSQPIS